MAKTREELQEQFHVRVMRDGETIFVGFFRNEDDPEGSVETAKMVRAQLYDIFKKNETKVYNIIADYVASDSSIKVVAPEAREIYREAIAHPQIHKIAFIVSNSFLASMIEMMVYLAGKKKKAKIFTDVEEAKKWLKEE